MGPRGAFPEDLAEPLRPQRRLRDVVLAALGGDEAARRDHGDHAPWTPPPLWGRSAPRSGAGRGVLPWNAGNTLLGKRTCLAAGSEHLPLKGGGRPRSGRGGRAIPTPSPPFS